MLELYDAGHLLLYLVLQRCTRIAIQLPRRHARSFWIIADEHSCYRETGSEPTLPSSAAKPLSQLKLAYLVESSCQTVAHYGNIYREWVYFRTVRSHVYIMQRRYIHAFN